MRSSYVFTTGDSRGYSAVNSKISSRITCDKIKGDWIQPRKDWQNLRIGRQKPSESFYYSGSNLGEAEESWYQKK